jgi:hypothetical protein
LQFKVKTAWYYHKELEFEMQKINPVEEAIEEIHNKEIIVAA